MNSSRKINKEGLYKNLIKSDIFNLTPELQNKELSSRKINNNYSNSKKQNLKNEDHFNLITQPLNNTKIKTGKSLKEKPLTDILNIKNKEIIPKKTIMTAKKNLSKLYFGNDKDYIVKKELYISNYNPDNFMIMEDAYMRKMKNIYGNKCSSAGKWKKNVLINEEKSLQEENKQKKITPSFIRVTKNHNIGNSKKENINNENINPRLTKIKMLESNIFNLSSQDNFNKSYTLDFKKKNLTSNNTPKKNREKEKKNHLRSSSNITKTPANINGLDWKNNNLELYTTREYAKNYKNNSIKTAFQRKLQNEYLSNNNIISNKKERINTKNDYFNSKFSNSFQIKNELMKTNDYTFEKDEIKKLLNENDLNSSRQKKLAEGYSSSQSVKCIENILKKRAKNRSVDGIKDIRNSNYEIRNIGLNDEKIITKTLLDNGINIYDIKNSNNNILGGENHLRFKIRENLNDVGFKKKLKSAKIELKQKTGKDLINIKPNNNIRNKNIYYENIINRFDNKKNNIIRNRRHSSNEINDDNKNNFSSRHEFSNTFISINHKYKNPLIDNVNKLK